MDDDRPPACARCCATRQVLWCPAFGEHLCPDCRTHRTDDLLDAQPTPLPVTP